jgi:hypothetical protein
MLRNMIHDVQAIAVEVIRKIHKPADAALRECSNRSVTKNLVPPVFHLWLKTIGHCSRLAVAPFRRRSAVALASVLPP